MSADLGFRYCCAATSAKAVDDAVASLLATEGFVALSLFNYARLFVANFIRARVYAT